MAENDYVDENGDHQANLYIRCANLQLAGKEMTIHPE